MDKKIIIGIVAFGGLVLLFNSGSDNPALEESPEEHATQTISMPPEFPTYPNSQVIQVNETFGEDGRTFYSISLETTDSVKEVNDWYREALNQNGWGIKSDKNVAGYQIIQSENNNLYTSMQAAGGRETEKVTISQQAQIR
tara:strand:+ start:3093 stop:3515 length:423 start_codon:yes stop_codon:yes gene_type:complete